ncbi:hypothetical protein FKM82_011560 [Ascaphus truei]
MLASKTLHYNAWYMRHKVSPMSPIVESHWLNVFNVCQPPPIISHTILSISIVAKYHLSLQYGVFPFACSGGFILLPPIGSRWQRGRPPPLIHGSM